MPAEVREVLLPLVHFVETLRSSLTDYDQKVEKLAAEKYPQTERLRQGKGVGPLTSLADVLTLDLSGLIHLLGMVKRTDELSPLPVS